MVELFLREKFWNLRLIVLLIFFCRVRREVLLMGSRRVFRDRLKLYFISIDFLLIIFLFLLLIIFSLLIVLQRMHHLLKLLQQHIVLPFYVIFVRLYFLRICLHLSQSIFYFSICIYKLLISLFLLDLILKSALSDTVS